MTADGFVMVATLGDVPAGSVKYVEAGGVPLALCNVDGEIFAVGNVCTHDGGPLSGGALDDHTIECPRHGARFDVRSGAVACLPAVKPIPQYPVKIDGTTIAVKVR